MRVALYLDGGIGGGPPLEALEHSRRARQDLIDSGFLILSK
jgi:hypothetical protein